ncbi:right-handed parallel beta-helix repeat-containing protein [Spirosoma validum]|uniref:Right-handed parallel beta-helix repeat-containing protein n=1 Tax=Spirosoma validum TaxID=2771355 RepID=A0A927GC90_9BACT|nr:right-handed parallel beta-helix repeat-containing protein [Spirosoma validum]MBD2752275.1 right-handed parallel beta-helix repeat-containing protein [Spirosoma validum]
MGIRIGLVLSIWALTWSIASAQTTYYVANTGSDENDGRSLLTPFQNLAKVNTLSLQAGDAVLFRRGDTFRGSLQIRKSGSIGKAIRFDAYGNGPKPLLTGSVVVSNWTSLGNNRWQASCSTCGTTVTNVFRNGLAQPLGRYPNPDAPNRGSLTVQAHVGTSQLTSREPLRTDWTGAEVVLRPTYWIIDRATITQQNENNLILNNSSTYPLTEGWGYFIQNHPATLDQSGEWYYNPTSKTIQLYTDQINPNAQVLTAAAVDRVIDIAGASFIILKNLHIAQARTTNLYALNVSNLTLTDTDFTDSGEDGVIIQGEGKDILINRCSITNSNNNGFVIGSYQNVTFQQNIIRHTAILPGRGKSGDGQFTAFQSSATQNTLIEHNIIDSVGYIGLSVQNNSTIRQNLITNFCMTKSDGGGIYLFNGAQLPMDNILVQSNIIRNGIGTFGGLSDNVIGGAHGIFLDDCVNGVDLVDNTIADCQGLGIYLHSVSNLNLLRNTCFNNSLAQLILYNYDRSCLPRNNIIKGNILVAKNATQAVAGYISSANDLAMFGTMEHNYYARPFNDVSIIRSVYNGNIVNDLNLPQWQAQFSRDGTSKPSPISYKEYSIQSVSNVNRIHNSFDSNTEGWEAWGPYSNGQVTWNTGYKLDGGNLQLNVSTLSHQADSYVLMYKGIQAVTKSKSYLLQFDATSPTERKISVFIRKQQAPYQDLTRRYEFIVGPSRRSYEFALTPSTDEANALLTFQFHEDSQPVCFDNIRLQEASIVLNNPDDFIRFVYNPTSSDSTVTLDKPYRDVRNHYYNRQVTLKPFTSVILLLDTFPPVDIRLWFQTDQPYPKINEVTSFSVALYNESVGQTTGLNKVQWTCRLPAGLTLVNSNGLSYKDSLLTGTVQHLQRDTTFVFQVKTATPGSYSLAAEVTATTFADPDSTPDSGTNDGEDDSGLTTLRVRTQTDTTAVVTATDPLTGRNSIYPNPSSDVFTFVAEADISLSRVVDLLGRERLNLGAIRQGQTIRFGQQLPGTYYLLYIQYNTGEQRIIKLIKR